MKIYIKKINIHILEQINELEYTFLHKQKKKSTNIIKINCDMPLPLSCTLQQAINYYLNNGNYVIKCVTRISTASLYLMVASSSAFMILSI